MTKKTTSKRPPIHAAKATIMKALKKLTLKERVEVVAAAFASMGLPFLASILREANT